MRSSPANRGPAVVKVAITSPIVASLFVFLRLYSRAFLTCTLGWDDFGASLTLLSSIAYSVLVSKAAYNGAGRHQYDMSDDQMERYRKWLLISSELYLLTLLGYKLTILMTYHRIFSISRRFKYICWTIMFITTAYLVSNMITEVTGCQPLRKFWDENVSGHCANYVVLDLIYGTFNVLTDFAIAVLPLRTIWRLRMDRREKIGVFLIFLTAIIAFVVALIRWIIGCVVRTSKDSTWIAGLVFVWMVLEINTGLICACSLPLKPLFRHVRKSPFFTKVTSWRRLSNCSSDTSKTAESNIVEKNNPWAGEGRRSDALPQEQVMDSVDREMRRLGAM